MVIATTYGILSNKEVKACLGDFVDKISIKLTALHNDAGLAHLASLCSNREQNSTIYGRMQLKANMVLSL